MLTTLHRSNFGGKHVIHHLMGGECCLVTRYIQREYGMPYQLQFADGKART